MAPLFRRTAQSGRHEIGLVVNIEPKYQASDDPADIAATARAEAYMNRQYLDPVFFGHYPKEMVEIFGEAWPDWPSDDFALIQQPIDFLGVNYYTRSVTRFDANAWPLKACAVRQKQATYTETGWEVFAPGLTETLLWVKRCYGDIPLYVTENGSAFFDPPTAAKGRVEDPLRVDYLREHIGAVRDAIAQGVDVRGYMAWSLLDNLEWSLGYSKRFGIVHVNFATQQRTPKDSAHFYAKVVASNGAVLEEEHELADLTWQRDRWGFLGHAAEGMPVGVKQVAGVRRRAGQNCFPRADLEVSRQLNDHLCLCSRRVAISDRHASQAFDEANLHRQHIRFCPRIEMLRPNAERYALPRLGRAGVNGRSDGVPRRKSQDGAPRVLSTRSRHRENSCAENQ